MKKYHVFLIVSLIGSLMFSCKRQKSIEEQMDKQSTVCYFAIDRNDTAWLKIDTSKKTQIIGLFEMHYTNEKRKMEGQFKGTLNGDTIKGHYDFKVNGVDKWYRNPVAFLKKEGKLEMGVGQITMIWGSAFFDQKVPVDFEKGRFMFEQADCQ